MKYFLCSTNTYVGKVLKSKLGADNEIAQLSVVAEPVEAEEGAEVAEDGEAAAPKPAATPVVIDLWQDPVKLKELVLECDCFLLDLIRDAEKSKIVLGILKAAEIEDPKTVIGLSSVMTWSKTESKKKSLKESDYKIRKSSPKYKELKMMESLVLNAKSDTIRSYVAATGILFGGGEEDFASIFREAWMCESDALTVIGDGSNVIPTLHVNDLCAFVERLSGSPPPTEEKQYMVVTDGTNSTQLQIIQAIASGLGTGKITNIAADDESLLTNSSIPVDIMLTNLSFNGEGSYQSSLEMELSGAGIGAGFDSCRNDFVASRGLKPVRACVMGFPGAGKTFYSSKLATKAYVPHITLGDIIKEAAGAGNEDAVEINRILEEAAEMAGDKKKGKAKKGKGKGPTPDPRPRIPTQLLTKLVHQKLRSAPCRNKGFVLDGYPRTLEEAEALFKKPLAEGEEPPAPEEDEDGNPIPPPIEYNNEFMVESVILLDVTQECAQQRCMAIGDEDVVIGHNDEDGFLRRWDKNEWIRSEPKDCPTPFFSQLEILEVPQEFTEKEEECLEAMNMYIQKNGKVFNFHPTEAEVAAANAIKEQQGAERAATAAADAEAKLAAELAERESWKNANENRKNMVQVEDQELVEQCSLPLRKYLMTNVIPKLVDGLVEVCKVAPEDPVDYLAEFLFKTSVGKTS